MLKGKLISKVEQRGNMSALKKISSNLYQWSEFSTEKQLNFNGYYLIHNGEAVIIDPPVLLDNDLQSL